jgi:hypothetical protein
MKNRQIPASAEYFIKSRACHKRTQKEERKRTQKGPDGLRRFGIF